MQAVRIYGTNMRSHFRTHGHFSGGDLPPAFVQLSSRVAGVMPA